MLDRQEDALSKRPKLSANVAYKHSSVVPRDADVQNHRIFVGGCGFVLIECGLQK